MSDNFCHIDFETRGVVDLMKRGSYIYFESPYTEPLMASYILNGGPVRRWLPHEPCPPDIRQHVEAGGMVAAHNCGSFERLLWQRILTPRYGWPELRLEQCRCTLAVASALGLPRSLEKLGDALNLTVKKDKAGKELIRFFCLPRKPRDDEDPNGVYFNEPADHPEKFARFHDYCDDDVRTEAEADSRMIPLSDDEQAVWILDQKINDRGIRIDRRSAIAAINLVEKAKVKLDAEMQEATGYAVNACSQIARLRAWIDQQGVPLDGVAKDDILAALQLVDLPANVRRALLLRQEAGKSSTSKLKAFLARAGRDGRARGAFVYHGAAPGRWCLAEGSMIDVKTPNGTVCEKPIENVAADDLVWDGDNWVSHDGVVFSGVKTVIEHDKVVATPEHIVYIDDETYMSLGEARDSGVSIYVKDPKNI